MGTTLVNANYHLLARRILREQKAKTPFLMLDTTAIHHALSLFDQYIPLATIYYAVKANPNSALLKYLASLNISFDVASRREIEGVIAAGVESYNLLLSTPIKTADTMSAMFEYKVKACAVDTVDELHRIEAFRKSTLSDYKPQIFVRLRIDSSNVEVNLNTKFGCTVTEALTIVEECLKLKYQVEGISFHVGTQSKSADNYFVGVQSAMMVAHEAMRRFKVKIPVINIGGGFCDPEFAARNAIDLKQLYSNIGKACQEAVDAGFKIYAEPGRSLVNSAGTLVTSVVGTTVRNQQRWAFLDDGIYGCFSIKMYEKCFFDLQVISTTRTKQKKLTETSNWTVTGPTCDSLDVVAEDVELPSDLSSGDVLMVPNLGAYTLATASSFNGFEQPSAVLVTSSTKRARVLNSPGKKDGKVVDLHSYGRRRRRAAA